MDFGFLGREVGIEVYEEVEIGGLDNVIFEGVGFGDWVFRVFRRLGGVYFRFLDVWEIVFLNFLWERIRYLVFWEGWCWRCFFGFW